jgi:hypothetical protein
MKPEAKRFIRFAISIGIVVFLATSLITNPGRGTGADGKIKEIERHFGWPAEYYADIWKTDSPNEPNVAAYMLLVPLSGEMQFGYHDFSLAALVLNFVVAVGFAVLLILLGRSVDQERVEGWVAVVGGITILIGALAFYFAEDVGAGL